MASKESSLITNEGSMKASVAKKNSFGSLEGNLNVFSELHSISQ